LARLRLTCAKFEQFLEKFFQAETGGQIQLVTPAVNQAKALEQLALLE
jgi:hypothetical protein